MPVSKVPLKVAVSLVPEGRALPSQLAALLQMVLALPSQIWSAALGAMRAAQGDCGEREEAGEQIASWLHGSNRWGAGLAA